MNKTKNTNPILLTRPPELLCVRGRLENENMEGETDLTEVDATKRSVLDRDP